jgi:LysM repeat protein
LPWADFFLFAVIGGVLALWWLRPQVAPSGQQIAQLERSAPRLVQLQVTPVQGISEELPPASPTPLPPTPTPAPIATLEPTATVPVGPIRHSVKSGDTVDAIAKLYGSTIKDVIQANNLSADGRLQVGQKLIVPVSGPMGGPGLAPTATPSGGTFVYAVQSGDTVSGIAVRLHSQIDWILKANQLGPKDYLRAGQSLLVPLSAATPTPTITVAVIVTPQAPAATSEPGLRAPVLLAPSDGGIVSSQDGVVLNWTTAGILGPDEWYVVTLRPEERTAAPVTWWTKGTTWRLPTEYRGTSQAGMDFRWQVQVRTGSADHPGETISPSSVERRFTWR